MASSFTKKNRLVIFITLLIFIGLRIAGDTVFFFLGILDSSTIAFWQLISSIIVIASMILYFFSSNTVSTIDDNSNLSEKYNSEYLRLFFMYLFLTLITIISPSQIPDYYENFRFIDFFFSEIAVMSALVVSSYSLWFLYKWLLIRRHKQTSFYLKTIGIFLSYLFFIEIVGNLIRISPSLDSLNRWLIFLLAVFIFIATKKNSWIASLPRQQKLRVFWYSLTISIASIINYSLYLDGSSLHYYLASYLPGGNYLFTSGILFIGFYSIRIFFAVVASFPTTSIVERKTSELTSLTYLNRFITDSASNNINNLLDTVTQLAIHASGATIVWTEVYDDENNISIGSAVNVSPEALLQLHKSFRLKELFLQQLTPLLVESLPEARELIPIKKHIPKANAMIAVPLLQGTKRFGTLVVIDSEEFGFEYDDIRILAAFGDNVNLALVNALLLKDSIAKERALNELEIAKRIQKELLPHSLPVLDNFKLASYTRPAEEVGGDYYDFAKFSDGNPCILIGDVSGKGMSAAFYMAQLKGVVQSLAEQSTSPADLLRKINRTLFGLMDRQSYITMLVVKLDDKSGLASFARAGHPPLIAKVDNQIVVLQPKGLGIGLVKSAVFDSLVEDENIQLQSGDSLIMITDGINELRDLDENEFGYEPIKSVLKECDASPDLIIEKIKEQANKHLSGGIAHDDITLVAIAFK